MRMSPGQVADEMRVAAAAMWYARGPISQGQGAEMAGMQGTPSSRDVSAK